MRTAHLMALTTWDHKGECVVVEGFRIFSSSNPCSMDPDKVWVNLLSISGDTYEDARTKLKVFLNAYNKNKSSTTKLLSNL